MTSPATVRISTAAAISLGLIPGRMHRCAATRCLNLLLAYPEGCRTACSYCGLARRDEPAADGPTFIRVGWPEIGLNALIERVAGLGAAGPFERMCISMVSHPEARVDTLAILRRWTERLGAALPVSILSNPPGLGRDDIAALRDAGADTFTVALDAATQALFEGHRGRAWPVYWRAFEDAATLFGPGRTGMHLICGLGETDAELLAVVQAVRDRSGRSHLFAFQPEAGSRLEDAAAVPRDRWRRVQLARYLIDFRGVRLEAMRFDGAGRLEGYGLSAAELEPVVASGVPFRTSGCPGRTREDVSACDRPYGDSSPRDIASYPFAPDGRDLRRIRRQLGVFGS